MLADEYIDRVRMEFGKLAQGEPTASLDFDFKREFMDEAIGGHAGAAHDAAILNQLHQPLTASNHFI